MTRRRTPYTWLTRLVTLTALALAASPSVKASCSSEGGGSPDEVPRLPEEEDESKWMAAESKRVGFNAWGGKRQNGEAGGEWADGRSGVTDGTGKRVGFNAWGGKRNQFSSWGGKRTPPTRAEAVSSRAFFPWGGKRDSEEAGTGSAAAAAVEEDGQRGAVDWGQPEEVEGSRDGETGAVWGRPFGRGRRSPSSSKSHSTSHMMESGLDEAIPWERKRLAVLWRAAKLQPARQNRRAVGADFFPWGGKRSKPSA